MEDFPVYARSVTPNGPTKAGPGEIGGPVVVGGRSVRPGDIVAADEDGVVVVPMERADAVADAAHALQEKEEKILHRILQDGVFDRPWLNAQLQALGLRAFQGLIFSMHRTYSRPGFRLFLNRAAVLGCLWGGGGGQTKKPRRRFKMPVR